MHPVPVFDESLRRAGPITDPPVEDREDVAREIFLTGAIDRSKDVAPALGIDRVRGLREQASYFAQRRRAVCPDAGPDIFRCRVAPPELAGHGPELFPCRGYVAAMECHDRTGKPTEVGRVGFLTERGSDRLRRVRSARVEQRAYLLDYGVAERPAGTQRIDKHVAL